MNKFDFENSIGFIINRTAKVLIHVFDQELRKDIGITFGQWKVIIILVNNDTGLTQKEIADKLGLEGPTIIPIIDKLEKDGFVFRQVDKTDRRINRIFLTEKTNNSLDQMINCGLKIKKVSLNGISENNVSITKDTLERMWQNIHDEFNLNLAVEDHKQKRNTIQEVVDSNTGV